MQEAKAFTRFMGRLTKAITNPDSIALDVYTADIINGDVRDKIYDCQESLKKKQLLLRVVEAQIQLQPEVYYKFVEILSEDRSMEHICQEMRKKCGKSKLCITSFTV